MRINKKVWPDDFKKIMGKKSYMEMRLADFKIGEGDTLILREWDPETEKYTGRELKFHVNDVKKIKLTKYYDIKKVEKHGIYIMELKR
jgi:hypothetical protein